MQVEASVDEADIGQIRDGQDVSFTVDSYPQDVFRAKVRQVRKAPVETQNVVSYLVIIDVDNSDEKLLPGMTANVEIVTGIQQNVTRVPTSALRFRPRPADREQAPATPDKKDDGKQAVYLAGADPYRPTRRRVTTGLQGDEFTEVTSGLKPGEKIVIRSKSLKPKAVSDDSADENGDDAS
jgi:HlyD family secretion protein